LRRRISRIAQSSTGAQACDQQRRTSTKSVTQVLLCTLTQVLLCTLTQVLPCTPRPPRPPHPPHPPCQARICEQERQALDTFHTPQSGVRSTAGLG
jgi:hypothetical protein